jgi:hypothetical protein
MTDDPEEAIGYGQPPVSTRFRKGQSGNPRGRPKGRKTDIPYDAVLGQMVTIQEGGRERKVTAAEAFLMHLAKQGLEGDGAAATQTMALVETAREKRLIDTGFEAMTIRVVFVSPGSVNSALEPLRMARKLDRYRPTARMALEPWIVEAALQRLGGRRLTSEEQRTVVEATRTPRKVNWPEWWTEIPE